MIPRRPVVEVAAEVEGLLEGGGAGSASLETLDGQPALNAQDQSELYTRGSSARTISSTFAADGWRFKEGSDIVVRLPGSDFVLTRQYSNGPMMQRYFEDVPWQIGRGWQTSAQSWLVVNRDLSYGVGDTGFTDQIEFVVVHNTPLGGTSRYYRDIMNNSDVFYADGPGTESITLETVDFYAGSELGTVQLEAWISRKAGQGVRAYYYHNPDYSNTSTVEPPLPSAMNGLVLFDEDAYGNRNNYSYKKFEVYNSGVYQWDVWKVDYIYLHGTSELNAAAWVKFSWDEGTSPSAPGTGRMISVSSFRRVETGGSAQKIETQRVDYTYLSDLDPLTRADLTSEVLPDGEPIAAPLEFDNLVQAKRSVRLNLPVEGQGASDVGDPEWNPRVSSSGFFPRHTGVEGMGSGSVKF